MRVRNHGSRRLLWLEQRRDGHPLFLCPRLLPASGSLAWTSARLQKPSMQQEQQPSPQYQPIITSNSLLFLSLSFTHRPYQSGTGPGRRPLSTMKRAVLPAHGQSCQPILAHLCLRRLPVSVHTSGGLKGKWSCLHRGCFLLLCQKERRLVLLFSEKSLQIFICEFYRLRLFMISYINLFMVQTDIDIS